VEADADLRQYNMVRVRGGTFTMGCTTEQGSDCDSDEKPAHQVTVSDFYIGKYEVSRKEWREVMGGDPPEFWFKGCDACPVGGVSWDDIQQFISKLNAKTGKTYRLPTEAEWEYAARGGLQSRGYKYAGSNSLDEVAWYDGNSGIESQPVGQKKANELGLYDMSGNVDEWCVDDWHDSYFGAPSTGRAWVDSPRASCRVFRGGSSFLHAQFCRVSFRSYSSPSTRGGNLGFRLAL
jgi:formylglycine-generating enzyme required for sulfatase activity